MTPLEEAELEWYFSRGQTAFERSTFGGVLERAELFSIAREYRTPPRDVCNDDGVVIGHESGITARPTAELRSPPGYEPDSNTLRRYAVVSTRLKKLAACSRRHADVLEYLYGDLGQRWAGNEQHGRLGALYHLTPKGKALLQAAREAKGALDRPDVARMEVICAVQRVQPNAERAQALAYCRAQATAMAQSAKGAWSIVKPRAA